MELIVKKFVCFKCGKKRVRKRLIDLPSIKAVPTVFCPDCRWWNIEKKALIDRLKKEFENYKIEWETKNLRIFTDK